MKKNLTFKELIFVASMLFWDVFWRGKFDLSDIYGTACRPSCVGGIGRFSDHRCRASASWCGGAWRQPERRTFGIKQSDRQKIRSFLYVSFVFDDRAFFCNPKMRYGFVYSWNRAVYFRRREDGRIGNILFCIFAVVLFFSLKPGQILTWIGKILNPLFLILLSIFVIRALFHRPEI